MSKALQTIHTDDAPAAIGPYAQAIRLGDMVFTSGQIPMDPKSGQMVEGGIEAQTRQVFANMKAVLNQAGTDFSKVVKTTVFLQDLNDFVAMNAIYASVFGDHKPARSTVEVAKLPKGSLVEIEMIATV